MINLKNIFISVFTLLIFSANLQSITFADDILTERDKIILDDMIGEKINTHNADSIIDKLIEKPFTEYLTMKKKASYNYVLERIFNKKLHIDCKLDYSDKDLAKKMRIKDKDVMKLHSFDKLTNKQICLLDKSDIKSKLSYIKAATINGKREYRQLQLQDENGNIDPAGLSKGLDQKNSMIASVGKSKLAGVAGIGNSSWTEVGPSNIGGRTRTILIDPDNANIIFAGSVSGGIWKSIDAGASWAPINDFMASLSISDIVMDLSNHNIMYASTSEYYDNVYGIGLIKSTDRGLTWTKLAATNVANDNGWKMTNDLLINGTEILAATWAGIYKSTDAGATWTKKLSDSSSVVTKIIVNPFDSNKLIASSYFGPTFTSSDKGNTWVKDTTNFTGRADIVYSKKTSGLAFASVDNTSGYIYKSTDNGLTWTAIYNTQHLGAQGWYDNTIWIDPTNDNNLIVGGVDLYRSIDGGYSWTQISTWQTAPRSPHADNHTIVENVGFNGSTNKKIYIGNDGGIYKTDDYLSAGIEIGWTALNNNYAVTQFYSVAGVGNLINGGTQDNGSLSFTGNANNKWGTWFGGDGGYSDIDPTDPNYVFGEYVYLQLHRSVNGGVSADNWIYQNLNSAGSLFIAPFMLDPNDSNRMYAGGSGLQRSNNVKQSDPILINWSEIKPNAGFGGISSIEVSRTNSGIVWVGYPNGRLAYTTDANNTVPTWTVVDTSTLPSRMITSIHIKNDDPNTVFITFGGYPVSVSGNIFKSVDSGATWTSVHNNLPYVPVYSLAQYASNPNWLYVGTEIGLFASKDGGVTWGANTDGPGNVMIQQLRWQNPNTLLAATYGRGIFKGTIDTTLPANPTVNIGSKTFNAAFNVIVTSDVGTTNYYTLNGVDPTISNSGVTTGQNITIPAQTTTLKVMSVKVNGSESSIVSYSYTFDNTPPTITFANFPTVLVSNSGSIDFTGTCSEVGQLVYIKVTDAIGGSLSGSTSCTSTWLKNMNLSSLSDGTLTGTITQYDTVGNTGTVSKTSFKKVLPTGINFAYSKTTPTNQNVTVTGTISDITTITSTGGFTQVNPTTFTKTFTGNGSGTITFTDSIGFSGSGTATVSNIDKVAPTITFAYSKTTPTNQNVTVTGTITEPITMTTAGGFTSVNSTTITKTFTSTGASTVYFIDSAGNTGSGIATVNNIDKSTVTITNVKAENTTSTGTVIKFNFLDPKYTLSTGTGYVTIGSGSSYNNISTGSLSISLGSTNTGSSAFNNLTGGTQYNFKIYTLNEYGNSASYTGIFQTATVLIDTTGTSTNTGSTTLTGNIINSGSNLSVSGANIIINSNPLEVNSVTGSLTISGAQNIVITAGSWNGIIISPTLIASGATEAATNSKLTALITALNNASTTYVGNVLETIKIGGEKGVSLSLSGSNFKVSFQVPNSTVGKNLRVYRSIDGTAWEGNSPDTTCTLDSNKMCTIHSNHLSYFSVTEVTGTPVVTNGCGSSCSSGSNGGGGGGITVITPPASTGSTNTGTTATGISDSGTTSTGSTSLEDLLKNISKSTPSVKGKISFLETMPITFNYKFKDTGDSFAKNDIIALASRGILKGYTDGSFRPNNEITRAEFLAITMKSFGITVDDSIDSTDFTEFTDLGDITWTIKYVEKAKEYGIKGELINNKKVFRPNDKVSRGEALAIIFRLLEVTVSASSTNVFSDIETNWIIPYANKAKELGITSGQLVNSKLIFRPSDSLTRAEAARMITKSYKLSN